MAVLNISVPAGNRDGFERGDGPLDSTSDYIWVQSASSPTSSSFRSVLLSFPLNVAQGTHITAATLTFVLTSAASFSIKCHIHCEDIDNSPDLSTNANIISRTVTTAFTSWVNTNVGSAHQTINSPDFTAALQEVVDRPGFSYGNYVSIILEAQPESQTGACTMESYESVSYAAPILNVTYDDTAPDVEFIPVPSTGTASGLEGIIQPPEYWMSLYDSSRAYWRANFYYPWANSSDSYLYYFVGKQGITPAVRMFVLTDDTDYLDDALELAWLMINHASNVNYLPGSFNDGYLGWYSANDSNEAVLRESLGFREVAAMLHIIRTNPTVSGNSYYQDQVDDIVDFMDVNIMEKWMTRSLTSLVYRVNMHMTSHWAMLFMYMADLTPNPTLAATYQGHFETMMEGPGIGLMYGSSYLDKIAGRHPSDPLAMWFDYTWDSNSYPAEVWYMNHSIGFLVHTYEYGAGYLDQNDLNAAIRAYTHHIQSGTIAVPSHTKFMDGSGGNTTLGTDMPTGMIPLAAYDTSGLMMRYFDNGPVYNYYNDGYYAAMARTSAALLGGGDPTGGAIDFGQVGEGLTGQFTIEVINHGDGELTLASDSITGTDSAFFSVNSMPSTVDADSTDYIVLDFDPDEVRLFTDVEFTFNTNDDDWPTPIYYLSGEGIAVVYYPAYDSSPVPGSTVDFGTANVGVTAPFQNVVISEVGENTLTISGYTISGLDAGSFSVIAPGMPINILDGGSSVSLVLSYTARKLGTETATLTLTTNDPDLPTVQYTLTGTGDQPDLDENRDTGIIRVGIDFDNDQFIAWGSGGPSSPPNLFPSPITFAEVSFGWSTIQASAQVVKSTTDWGRFLVRTTTLAVASSGIYLGKAGSDLSTVVEIPVTASTQYSVSLHIRGVLNYSGADFYFYIGDDQGATWLGPSFTIDSTWNEREITFTTASDSSYIFIVVYTDAETAGIVFDITGPMLVEGDTVPNFNTGVLSLYEDLTDSIISAEWSLGATSPDDKVASEGSAKIRIDNASRLYSPGLYSGPLYGSLVPNRLFVIGIYDGNSYQRRWTGVTQEINPDVGAASALVEITGVQGMYKLDNLRYDPTLLFDVSTGEVISSLLGEWIAPDEVSWVLGASSLGYNTVLYDGSLGSSIEAGRLVYPYYGEAWLRPEDYDDVRQKGEVRQIINELADAELGLFYLDRDGHAVFLDRDRMFTILSTEIIPVDIDTEAVTAIYSYGINNNLYNTVRVKYYPKEVVEGVIYSSDTGWDVDPGESRDIAINFEQSDQKITPISIDQFGLGSSFSSDLSTLQAGIRIESSREVVVTFTNNDDVAAHVSDIELSGTGLVSESAQEYETSDSDSILEFGRRVLNLDFKALWREDEARTIAQACLIKYSRPRGRFERLDVINRDTDWLDRQISFRIGQSITINEYQTGETSNVGIIVGERHVWQPAVWRTSYIIGDTDANAYWILGISALGISTILGY